MIALIASFILALFTGYFLFEYFLENGFDFQENDQMGFFDYSLVQHLIVVGISTSLGISKIAMENVKQKKQAIAKQRETELNYLKAQVSPHFLFNTLNTIYALANEEHASQTSEAIVKLSENMRYMVREATHEYVPLQKEIDFLQSYIDLQLLRLSGNAKIDFSINGDIQNQQIAPLLLIPLVENVFKHGVSYQQKAPILIELDIQATAILLKTKNAIKKQRKKTSSGIGLENVRKRLEYLYPGKHELKILQGEEKFEVFLKIQF